MRLIVAFVGSLLVAGAASAHEVRPAYLELVESTAGEVEVLWKTPMVGEMRLALWPRLSGASEELVPIATRRPSLVSQPAAAAAASARSSCCAKHAARSYRALRRQRALDL